MNDERRKIAILGSTGSIGTQALQVIEAHADCYEAYALTANNNASLLIEQARRFRPAAVVIANEAHYNKVREALSDLPIRVLAGAEALSEVVCMEAVDVVLASLVGYAGLRPTMDAIRAGKTIALANKETLVVAGELVTALAAQHGVSILPVDSEHSAIFQCLVGEPREAVEKIILTASGGPFRTWTAGQLAQATSAQALRHPNWDMGAKVTIDSASMMNKGFEVMEAKWLFNVSASDIEVVVHPQSVVHSMVQYVDGSVKAQLGCPDMRLPIQYAFTYPGRLTSAFPRVDFAALGSLTFEAPDPVRFPNLRLAFEAIARGGNMPCILNAANEVCVDAFLHDRVGFLRMSDVNAEVMGRTPFIDHPTFDDYAQTDSLARQIARDIIYG